MAYTSYLILQILKVPQESAPHVSSHEVTVMSANFQTSDMSQRQESNEVDGARQGAHASSMQGPSHLLGWLVMHMTG